MKKIFLLMLVLCLAVPAVSYAGSATSRWDLIIGGTIKFDMGLSDNEANKNVNSAFRKGSDGNNHPNFFMSGDETGLTFFVRGPDAWGGAKTSAFIAADFTGQWTNGIGSPSGLNGNSNTFSMTIAKLTFDWPTRTLTMRVMPSFTGLMGTFGGNTLGWGNVNDWNKGFPNTPQIQFIQRFGKEFSVGIGARQFQTAGPGNIGNAAGVQNTWTNAGYPAGEGQIMWSSARCGKVGPWQLTARLSGTYGRERKSIEGNSESYADGYWTDFQFILPIIPEKQGNKTNALLLDLSVYQGQNGGQEAPAPTSSYGPWVGNYVRTDGEWAAPVVNGWIGHAMYYFTDAIFTNVWYGYTRAHLSNAARLANPNAPQNNQWIGVNLMYDVNPAIRLGLQWDQYYTRYGTAGFDGTESKGTANVYRFGAFYFF